MLLATAGTANSYARSTWRIGFPSNLAAVAVDPGANSAGGRRGEDTFEGTHIMRIDLLCQEFSAPASHAKAWEPQHLHCPPMADRRRAVRAA